MSAINSAEVSLDGACLVLVIRPTGESVLWLDEEVVDVEKAQAMLRAAAGHIPGDPDPEGVPSSHE